MTTLRNICIKPEMRERTAFYAAAFAASALGLACFNTVVVNNGFMLAAIGLVFIGFCVSYAVRAGLLKKSGSEAIVLAMLLILLATVLAMPNSRSAMLPDQVTQTSDMFMGTMLVWLMVACSFRLSYDRAVLFMCVPALSLIGLTATFAPDTEALIYFGLFLTLGSFILIKENALAYQSDSPGTIGRLRISAGNAKIHIGLTASVTLAAMVVGIALGTLLYPILVNSFARPLSPFSSSQIVEQLVGEEYVSVATGPVNLSNQELMTVKCDQPLLWRGRTYNKYTGQGWVTELGPNEQKRLRPMENPKGPYKPTSRSTFRLPASPLYETGKATRRVEQTFTVVSGYYHTVFAAAQPLSIKFRATQPIRRYGNWVPVLRYGSRIESPSAYGPKSTYTATSRVSTATLRQLSAAGQNYPELIKSRYLGIPDSSWQSQRLAERITTNEPNPYRKALAIRNYLAQSYTYDTGAGAAPANEDAITFFLFKSKRGYCDIFASSMVIMARQIGIPARWVTGFAPEDAPAEDGLYHVLAKDRHAWAELYFPGYGWVEFDATPSGEQAGPLSRLRELWGLFVADRTTLSFSIIILALIAYLIKSEVVDRLISLRHARRPSPQDAVTAEISRHYRRMCDLLARVGYPKKPSTTPIEFADQVTINMGADLKELSAAVDAVTADLVEFRYSPREPSADRVAAMAQTINEIGRILKTARKANLLPQNGTS